MKEQDTRFHLIEGYLEGTLSDSKMTEFHYMMENDDDFRREFQNRTTLIRKWKEAKNYESVRNRVAEVIENRKRIEKQKIFYWAAAVVILLLIIPGIFFLDSNKDTQVVHSTNQELLIEKPQNKASEFYYDETYSQLSPSNKQSIVSSEPVQFKWSTQIDVKTAISIFDHNNDSLIYSAPVNSSSHEYTLDLKLSKGSYYWQLEGFDGKQLFEIN